MSGRLIGIARAPVLRAPLEETDRAHLSVERGIEGDARGHKPRRQVTVLFREGWEEACSALGVSLPWVARRANLYVEGIERPRAVGGQIRIGDVILEVTQETQPCELMNRAYAGLKRALQPDWRAGVCCNVIKGGEIAIANPVEIMAEPH